MMPAECAPVINHRLTDSKSKEWNYPCQLTWKAAGNPRSLLGYRQFLGEWCRGSLLMFQFWSRTLLLRSSHFLNGSVLIGLIMCYSDKGSCHSSQCSTVCPSIHFLYSLSLGERQGTQRDTQPCTLTLTPREHLKLLINPTCFLNSGRKSEYLERTHTYTGRTCKLRTERESNPLWPPHHRAALQQFVYVNIAFFDGIIIRLKQFSIKASSSTITSPLLILLFKKKLVMIFGTILNNALSDGRWVWVEL